MLIQREKPTVLTECIACCDRCSEELGQVHCLREGRDTERDLRSMFWDLVHHANRGDVVLVSLAASSGDAGREVGLPSVLLCGKCETAFRDFLEVNPTQ